MTERKRAILELVSLCEKTAAKIMKQHIDIIVADEFSAIAPFDEEGAEEYLDLGITIDIVGERKKVIRSHFIVESEVFLNPANNYSYFTQSFFHEIGHLKTMKYFNYEVTEGWNEEFEEKLAKGHADLRNYKAMPHELLADVWSLFQYIPKHKKQVKKFDKKVKKLLKKIY